MRVENGRFCANSTNGSNTFLSIDKSDPRLKGVEEGLETLDSVFKLLRLLRFRSGAQFFSFNIHFEFRTPIPFNDDSVNKSKFITNRTSSENNTLH